MMTTLLNQLTQYLIKLSREHYILLILLISDSLFLFNMIGNFRVLTFLGFIIFFLLTIKLKNLLFSAFLTSIYLFPFFSPNKYYIVEIIRGSDLLEPFYRSEGYQLGYGLNAVNIFLILTLCFLFRDIVKKKINKQKLKLLFYPLGFSTIGFIVIAGISNLLHSPFSTASFVWLFQYTQLFITSGIFFYLFMKRKSEIQNIYPVILASIILQFLLSLLQFFKQSNIGLAIENVRGTWFATGLDENNAVLRVFGSLAFHNQLALVMLLYLLILIPYTIRNKSKLYMGGIIFSLITIILSQSRSVWIGCSVVLLVTCKYYFQELIDLYKKISKKKLIIYLLLAFVSLSYIIIPRVLLSFNASYEGAGIPIRIKLLHEGIQAFISNPWIGYGIGTNEYVLHSLFPEGVMSIFPSAQHLALLQLLLEIGVIGVIFILTPFIFVLRKKNKSSKLQNKEYRFIFLSGILAVFIYYLFLPHVGIIEFNYLGLYLGFGLINNTHEVQKT